MTKEREALRMALEALEEAHYKIEHKQDATKREQAITAINYVLAQPEQEPLEYWNAVEGWVKIDEVRKHFETVSCGTIYKTAGEGRVPLYTAPPKRQPLTDEQVDLIAHNTDLGDWNSLYCRDAWHLGFREGFREAETEHKIKGNHK